MKRLIVGTVLALGGVAQAGGIQFGEPGTQAMQRAGAFVAKADDPSALWTNPAGLVKTKNISIYVGGSFLHYGITVQRSGTYPVQMMGTPPAYEGDPYPEMSSDALKVIPSLGVAARFGNLGVSLGFYGPQGNPDRDFGCEIADADCQVLANGAPAPTRYDIVRQHALIGFPSVGVAYRVHDTLDVGLRLSWGFATISARSFTWGILNREEDPERDGDFEVEAHDRFVPTFGVGALYRPTPNLEFGLSYKFETSVRSSGDSKADLGSELGLPGIPDRLEPVPDNSAKCAPGGTPAILKACVNTKLPMSISAGGRYIVRDATGGERADVELDVRWENWSRASDTEIIVDARSSTLGVVLKPQKIRHGLRDTVAFRLGGSYSIPMGTNLLQLRAGAMVETGAAPNSWTRADLDGQSRLVLGTGVAYRFGKVMVDAGFAYGIVPSRTVQNVDVGTSPPVANREQPDPIQPLEGANEQEYYPYNAGTYDAAYWLGMVGVTVNL
jgi:long-chain fatty acid transport protein